MRLLLLLLLSLLLVFAQSDLYGPTASADPSSIASNLSFAYDMNNATSAAISPGGNVTFYAFPFVGPSTTRIISVDAVFDVAVNGIVNDQWRLEYSNNSGLSWIPLVVQNSSITRTVYTSDLNGAWNWSSLNKSLRLRISFAVIGGVDAAQLDAYEVKINVTTDTVAPSLILTGPQNGTQYNNTALVNFTYNVSDTLSAIANCSLYINGSLSQTNSSVSNVSENTFSESLGDGMYNWSIACFDESNNNVEKNATLFVDASPPVVSHVFPAGGATLENLSTIRFRFNATDISPLANCSLYLNNSLNATIDGLEANEFTVAVADGVWTWNVTCVDVLGRAGDSGSSSFTLSSNQPPLGTFSVTSPIVLSLGTNTSVQCNATVNDPQGVGTIASSEVFLHTEEVSWNASDETSTHHTGVCSTVPVNATAETYVCDFMLPYYVRAGAWKCSLSATDTQGATAVSSGNTTVESLLAFNVSTAGISYGTLSPGNISAEQSVTVMNLGNTELDLALDGYGALDGDGFSLVCDYGNTSVGSERYAITSGLPFASMSSLTDEPVQVDNLNLPPRNDSFNGSAALFWRLQLGVPSRGNCTGSVTFTGLGS